MLVDSHCHLDFPDFDDDRDAVVERARAAGIGTIVTICTETTKFQQVLAVARRYDDMYCSVGVHPHEAGTEPDIAAERLVELARDPKVVGIGETGLDFYYEHSPKDVQERVFRAHIAAARETGLPLIVHTRDADDDTVRILEDEHAKGAFPGVIHCFTASRRLAGHALGIGFYISLSGIVTFKSAQDIRDTVRDGVPPERILVETDAPYLAPVPNRGKRNEPANTAHTARYVADLLGMDAEAFAERTTDNFFTLFSKAARPGTA